MLDMPHIATPAKSFKVWPQCNGIETWTKDKQAQQKMCDHNTQLVMDSTLKGVPNVSF